MSKCSAEDRISQCSTEDRIKVKPLAVQDEKSCERDSITGLFPIPGCSGTAHYAVAYWGCGGHICEQHARLKVERFGPCVELVPVTEHETCDYESCGASAIYARTGAFADFSLCPAHTLQIQLGNACPVGATT